jgi:hypothetical protein
MLWAGRCRKAAKRFPLGPGWASKPLTPLDKGQSSTWATPLSPRGYGKEGLGREVPTQARVCAAGLDEQRLSMVLELYYRKAGGKREGRERERERERGHGQEETKGKGREREERLGREREREEERGERRREDKEKGERSERARRGQTAPFYDMLLSFLLLGNWGGV